MLANIFSALEQLGLSAQKRAIHVQFSNPSLNQEVFLQRLDGQHTLNEGVKAELICLSTNATISLKQFIGCQVSVDQVTENGTLFRTTGIITEAAQGQSDGSLTLYKLNLEDATTLWHKRRNSRVFMNKSAVEVIETIFQEWQNKSPLFAASLSLDLSGLQQQYDVRPFIMQSNETDYDFLTRLMRSEGINWLIDEAQHQVPVSATPIEAQKLRLIDDNSQYQALARRNIRFHRSSATEKQDSITCFIGKRSIQPTAVHVQRWQADVLEQEEGAGTVQSKHQHSNNQDNASLGLEQAWHFSPAWMQDLKGEDQATASSNNQIEKLNQNLSNYYDAQSKQFIASSTVRDIQVGYWFELNEHPEIDQHSGSDKEFLITGKQYYNQNNLPKDLTDQIDQLIKQSNWNSNFKRDHNPEERQGNSLILQRRNIITVPEYNPLQHRPAAHPQRAKVVGPSGEEIHVDEWGRIKVRFLFSRAEDNQADGGAGSNNNDTDSAWVDVLTPWAGEGYGARFLPRIDEIVVIDFFDGNIDRPFVVGRIHEAQRSPTKFDIKGQLPDTKKLAGIRSKEVQGEGYGQLRFDDTTGQISTQLQNSHGASQLNLGNLSHPKETEQSDGRGEGFELRTDQWGGIRAGQGLLLSTYKQDQATGTHLDVNEAKAQLETSLNKAKALSEVAKNQQTDPLEVLEELQNFMEQIEKGSKEKSDAFKQALMILAAPNSIALATNEDIHISADGQISHSAGDSINISTQKSLIGHASKKISLFAAQEGARLYAGKGKIEIQAQGDALDLIARKGVQIISTEDMIEFKSPKEIILTAGGSQLKINGSGIFSTTGAKFEVKAGQHLFKPGSSVNATLNALPQSNPLKGALEIVRSYGGSDFFKQSGYKVIDSLGKEITGKLDANGFAQVTGIAAGSAKIILDKDERSAWNPASYFERSYDWADKIIPNSSGFLSNTMNQLGQNIGSKLKDSLMNLDADGLKNIGKNALKDLGDSTFGQIKDQVSQSALGAISSQLNLNLSPAQIQAVANIAKNPSQSIQNIKDQGIDFFKDQATAYLKNNLSNGLAPLNSNFVAAESYSHVPEPEVVDNGYIGQKVYQSKSGGLVYTETTRRGQSENNPGAILVRQPVEHSPQPVKVTTPKIEIASSIPKPVEQKKESVYQSDDDFISQKYYQTGGLKVTETVRKVKPDDIEKYNASKSKD